MSDICYECDSQCVNTAFCYEGGSYGENISLPKKLNIKITANPAYWGFSGVLFSGEVEYGAGHFDYWDNFDENHLAYKNCNNTVSGPFNNEERSDIAYRSVYDPDTGTTTYNGNTEINNIGGPEVYLLDKTATYTSDSSSCDETDPTEVFKKYPENFGLGNKILFQDNIYKNLTAAWRGVESGVVSDINKLPGGAVVGEYAGSVLSSGIFRESSTTNFVQAKFSYNGVAASGLKTGQRVFIQGMDNSSISDGNYHIFNLTHNSDHTLAYLTGTFGETDFADTGNILWVAPGTYDEKSCQSEKAYGVDYVNKCLLDEPNYHSDLGIVINNSKNSIHSNRVNRDFPYGERGYQNTRTYSDRPRKDFTHVAVQEDGYALLTKEEVAHSVELGCAVGVWNPEWSYIYTSGDTHLSSLTAQEITDTGVAFDLSEQCGSGTLLGSCDITSLPTGWTKYVVDSGVVQLHSRALPFYGPLYEVYDYDENLRHKRSDNTITGRNGTCCTPVAKLEVFPDCITQQVEYTECNGGSRFNINSTPRLCFVYRGFNYNDQCTYDESGTPYVEPTGIEDLRNGIGGQEIYMYLNLGSVWAGEIDRDPCGCADPVPPGELPPRMVEIESPVTFPCFPKFDLRPDEYGAQDEIWKIKAAFGIGELSYTGDISECYEFGDYSYITQPYPTYGYVRNVCGKETNLEKSVIQSLASQNAGTYRNTTPEVNDVEPLYWNFDPVDNNYGSGLVDPVNDSGVNASWGVVDSNGRLVAPYYPVKSSNNNDHCTGALVNTYADFDSNVAFSGGWPTDNVPFLIEIDHDSNCVGCGTTTMSNSGLSITFTSLDNQYLHNDSSKWGYSHCQYNGIAQEPTFTCNSGFSVDACDTGNTYSGPYTGQTCNCLSSGDPGTLTLEMNGVLLRGTDIIKYHTTQNPSNSDNSYVRFGDCVINNTSAISDINEHTHWLLSSFFNNDKDGYIIPYVSARLSCYSESYGPIVYRAAADQMSEIYGCGGCSNSFPGVNNRPDLSLDWWLVHSKYADIFEAASDGLINNPLYQNVLTEGITANLIAYGTGCSPPVSNDPCTFDYALNERGCGECGNVVVGDFGIEGCEGSKAILYGCKLFEGTGVPGYTGWATNADVGRLDACLYPSGCGIPERIVHETGCFREDCAGTITFEYEGDSLVYKVSKEPHACGCMCVGSNDAFAEFTYYESYECTGTTTITNSWIMTSSDYPVPEDRAINFHSIGFSNMPYGNSGNLGILPIGQPIAIPVTTAYSHESVSLEPACSWKKTSSPNNTVTVSNKFSAVGRYTDVTDIPCDSLYPEDCNGPDVACSSDSLYGIGNCGNPIPFGSSEVTVRRKNAYPEIMIVNKIECVDSGYYKLHVSREYHEHKRDWQYPTDGFSCSNYYGGVDGGGYRYTRVPSGCNDDDCVKFYYDPCSDSAALNAAIADSGGGDVISGPNSNFYLMPHATPSDLVTPVYPTKNDLSTGESLCSYHPHSGEYPDHWVTRDFNYINSPYNSRYLEYEPVVVSGEFVNLSIVESPYTPSGCSAETVAPVSSCAGAGPNYNVTYEVEVSGFASSGDYVYINHYAVGETGSPLSVYTYKVENIIDANTLTLQYVSDSASIGDSSPCALCNGIGSSASCGIPDHDYSDYRTIWQELSKVPLTPAEVNNLESSESGVFFRTVGTGSCAGVEWATEQTGITLLSLSDSYGSVRYFADNGVGGACDTNQSYPNLVEKTYWSYYNLFYGSGIPDSGYYNHIERDGGQLTFYSESGVNFGPLFDSGVDIPLNRKHSCIQDLTRCGGDLWNNKAFFPRKPYESGTRVTAFGPLSICTQNSEYEHASWLSGYEDDIFSLSSPVTEAKLRGPFINACDLVAHPVTIQENCGIDDASIIVDDYLPLMGVSNIELKNNLGDYSCVQATTGCVDLYPIHTNKTIKQMTFVPGETLIQHKNDAMGYYLDKLVNSGVNECLFRPFKIMVDVECCEDNIRRSDQNGDSYDPTYMSWIATKVPSLVCKGEVGVPKCACSDTMCGHTQNLASTCVQVYHYTKMIPSTTCATGYRGTSAEVCAGSGAAVNGYAYDGYNTHSAIFVGFTPESSGSVYEETEFTSISCGGTPYCQTELDPATPVSIINGEIVYVNSIENWLMYECGDYLYVSDLPASKAINCCATASAPSLIPPCDIMADSFKIPNSSGTYIVASTPSAPDYVASGYTADFVNCDCNTPLPEDFSPCSSPSNLLIEITEN